MRHDACVDETVTSYDEWHHDREQLAGDGGRPTSPWHLLTIAHLPDVRGKKVLEIGCGRGVFARYLAEQGADLVAADFSPGAVAYARNRLRDHEAEVVVADVQAIPFADETFDIVVSQETLEHVPEPDVGLAELVRVTKVGGTLIVTTPNYLNLIGLYRIILRLAGRRFTELGQPVNQSLLLVQQVRRLRKLGCRVDAVDSNGQFLPVPGYDVVELRWLERPTRLMRWFGLNSLTKATRLA
jgi:2-polyprenyl-3-methyl-5-hydroxy-6-metoxy-1,4-benzoquinol methylase